MKAFLVQGGWVNNKNTSRKQAETVIWESVPLTKMIHRLHLHWQVLLLNKSNKTHIYDDQHFLPLNIENEIASFKPTLCHSGSMWSVLPCLFFFLEKVSHFVSMRIWNKTRKCCSLRVGKKTKQYKQMRERMIKQYDIIRNASPPCTVYIIRDGARIANSNWHHFWVCSIELLPLLQQAGGWLLHRDLDFRDSSAEYTKPQAFAP